MHGGFDRCASFQFLYRRVLGSRSGYFSADRSLGEVTSGSSAFHAVRYSTEATAIGQKSRPFSAAAPEPLFEESTPASAQIRSVRRRFGRRRKTRHRSSGSGNDLRPSPPSRRSGTDCTHELKVAFPSPIRFHPNYPCASPYPYRPLFSSFSYFLLSRPRPARRTSSSSSATILATAMSACSAPRAMRRRTLTALRATARCSPVSTSHNPSAPRHAPRSSPAATPTASAFMARSTPRPITASTPPRPRSPNSSNRAATPPAWRASGTSATTPRFSRTAMASTNSSASRTPTICGPTTPRPNPAPIRRSRSTKTAA